MAARSRTSEFKNARKSLYNSKKENSLIGLEYAHDNGLDDIIDLTPSHIRSFGLLPLPPWMSKQLTNIQQQLDDIRLNMDKLGDMHNELPSFNATGSNTHSEIEDFTTLLTTKFTKCGNSIKSFGKNVGPVGDSATRFFNAVRAHRIAMLQALSTEFERCQQQYLQNVMGQMKSSKYFDYKHDSDSDNDSDSPEYLKEFSTSTKSAQQQMISQDRKLINERDKQVKQLAKSIADITALYSDMAEMVVQQGTILDRIDYNIVSASEHVAHAVIELDEADKLEFSSGKCLLIFLLVIIVFTGVVLFALWSKRRNG